MKNRMLFSALFLLMAGSCSVAQAGQATHISTATSNLSVSSAAETTIEISPLRELQAGTMEPTPVATAHIHTTSGTIIYRWTPNTPTQEPWPYQITKQWLKSSANPALRLPVEIINTAEDSDVIQDTLGDQTYWMMTAEGTHDADFLISTVYDDDKDPEVVAGTYVMSLDATTWAY